MVRLHQKHTKATDTENVLYGYLPAIAIQSIPTEPF